MKPNKWLGLVIGMMLAWQSHADGFKLGYINIERVYREAKPAVDIMQRLNNEFSGRRDELKTLQAKGKKLEAQLVQSNLSDSERKNDQRELDGIIRDYNAKSATLTEDFNQRRAEEFTTFLQRANQMVRDIAEKEHYDLILQDSVYIDPKYDMTDRLLKSLNNDK